MHTSPENHASSLGISRGAAHLLAVLALALGPAGPARAQGPGSSGAPAAPAAGRGLPLSELAEASPDRYVVRAGDSLRRVASLYLRSPWQWPALWDATAPGSPPPIHPGQVLVLDRRDGHARLRIEHGLPEGESAPTQRLAPRVRIQLLPEPALPTLEPHLIEPFLAEPLVVDVETLQQAPRLVAAPEGRVLITRGDRAYARGAPGFALLASPAEPGSRWRVFRDARALHDPVTGEVLGYEIRFVGRAQLLRPEVPAPADAALPVPALLDIVAAREEIRAGDRLLPEPPREFRSYAPRAPQLPLEDARIAGMVGDAVGMAGQNQIVAINKGRADGLEGGHVLATVRTGTAVTDRSQPGPPQQVQLPDERNGLLMVFRVFERVSYALILETADGVKVGDRVLAPR